MSFSDVGFRPTNEPRNILYLVAVCSDKPFEKANASMAMDFSSKMLTDRELQITNYQHQISEKDQTIVAFLDQSAEKDQTIQSLKVDINTKEFAIQSLNSNLRKKDLLIHSLNSNLGKIDEKIQSMTANIADQNLIINSLTVQLEDRDKSNKLLSMQVANMESELLQIFQSNSWRFIMVFQRIRLFLIPIGTWREGFIKKTVKILISPLFIKRYIRIQKDISLIKSSDLFDAQWYIANNPDVSNSHMEPARHYLLFGGFEGRDRSMRFSSRRYLDTYADVKNAHINPLVHYLRYGLGEGRLKQSNQVPEEIIVNDPKKFLSGSRKIRYQQRLRNAFKTYRNEGTRIFLKKAVKKIAQNIRPQISKGVLDTSKVFNPQVSIIVPVFNVVEETKLCIESIYRESSSNISFELIVVDNASEDETSSFLKLAKEKYDNFTVLTMDHNIGFGPAVNQGILNSKGDYIVILNNDTVVSPQWLERLLGAIEQDLFIGIVSPVTNFVGEGPQIDIEAKDLPMDVEAIRQYAKSITDRVELCYEPNRLVFFVRSTQTAN